MEYRFSGISDAALRKLSHLVSEQEMEVTKEEHILHVGESCYKNMEVSCIISPKLYEITAIVWKDCIILYSIGRHEFSDIARIENNEYVTFTVM